MTIDWHSMKAEEAMKALESTWNGLKESEAQERLKHGRNELKEKKKTPEWVLFLGQFRNALVIILLLAAAVSALIGETLDAAVIIAIVMLNAVLGFFQERRAEKAMEALKKLSSKKAQVIRNGQARLIDSRELVPGDIVLLSVGDRVPADCRIVEALNLKADESVLTGESTAVEKSADAVKKEAQTAERRGMLFSGTTIVYGHCKAVVTETGMSTEFGKIASMLQQGKQENTPLQARLAAFSRQLGIAIVLIAALIFTAGYLQGRNIAEMFLTSVSLAVAAIPEGLPAVVTITLAIGLVRMARRNAIVRRLPAVETLGSTTIIASDKTGTLTVNKMTVRKLYVNGNIVEVTGEGYSPEGKFILAGKEVWPDEDMKQTLSVGMLCNDARLEKDIIGDPTEAALLVSAKKAGLADLRDKWKRTAEIPFDSQRKMMSVVCADKGSVMYTKGAAEEVLKRCSYFSLQGRPEKLTQEKRKQILAVNELFAKDALRVLAFAFRNIKAGEKPEESGLVFAGLQAMIDPPRPEVKPALDRCREAGIKVVMITGDHRETAVAVAKEIGILDDGKVLTGAELDMLSEDDYMKIAEDVAVYARVSPEHKVRITETLKKKGHVVAMTGDGVNDAPALKKADIGIAMGITGTDVTKEASSMVLTDDNFATIVSAVEEGRGIFDNIRKFINYMLGANIGEVAIILTTIMLNMPLPLLPLQLLWINIVTDGLPALALGMEPPEKNIMKKKPRNPKEKIMNRESLSFIALAALLMSSATLLQFYIELSTEGVEKARTVAFTTVVTAELLIALSARSSLPLHKIGIFTNKKLLIAILSSIVLQLAVVYVPFLSGAFGTVPMSAVEWMGVLAVSLFVFAALEGRKIIRRNKQKTI